jgi:HEAT repeats
MNWRLFFQLSLLSTLAAGVLPTIGHTTKAPATKAPVTKTPATKTAVAVKAESNPTFPWLVGGGAATIATLGGAVGLYRLGRNSGKQSAQIDRAVSQYRTLADLGPAIPSGLEAELSQLKTAHPPSPRVTDQELAAEQAEFTSDLHEYDAAQFVEPLDIDQINAAFADVDRDAALTATEQVLPMADRGRPVADPDPMSIAAAQHTIQATVQHPTIAAIEVEARHTTVEATVVNRPAPITHTARVENHRDKPAVHAAAIVVNSPTDRPGQSTAIVFDQSAKPNGELITQTRGIGLARPSRLPQVGAVENLIKEIQNPDPAKRRKAIWDLGQWGDTRAVQPLVDLMIEADSKQRSLILSALSEIGTRTIKPMSKALAISLQDDSADVRKNAIRDLTRIYDLVAQISQMVQKCAIDDPEEEVRDTANWALKQLNRIRPVGLDESSFALLSGSANPETASVGAHAGSGGAPERIG